jgi:hypothetical protein
MNKTGKRFLLVIVLCMLAAFILPGTVSANSAQPPSLIIIVNNPPGDLSIELVSTDSYKRAVVERAAWKGYFIFYSLDMKPGDEYKFIVTSNGKSFECTLDEPVKSYSNVYILDLSTRELKPGKYPMRSVFLVSIQVVLTLFLEGIIFWLFGFRQKRSWLIFLIVNLITQGALYILLNIEYPTLPGDMIFALFFGESFVFTAEMFALPILIKEKKMGQTLIYAFIANLVSLLAGGLIITVLPV